MGKTLIEEGYILIGHNSIRQTEKDKYEIINSSGKSSYDMVSGDNPSAQKEEFLCNSFSKLRLNNIKKWNNENLEKEFKSTLYLLADTGSDANKLSEHFFSGGGKLFSFSSSTNIAKEIKESSAFRKFKESLLAEIKKEMRDGSLKQENNDGTFEILKIKNVKLPYYWVANVFSKNDDAAAILGGIQLAIAKYKLYKEDKKYIAELISIYFYDTFGAGWEDACNTTKSYANGLVAMFVLQHYKNVENPNKYQPFVIGVEINL